ncbi:DUF2332 domain-containing protein [Ruania halotolerans]|uniref:DUF2332 domain-containing protein n=1 Tax=Ruania halotolerans TaxID=2897773 RepID=UPI001E353952|nr:DUF2332 domain-containing protein [Ruania halotolerans]UFU08151.1 DUF2332 domain-containing protein [Ruania halotolerans]
MQTQSRDTAEFYRSWAQVEAQGSSPQYQALAEAVAASPEAIAFLDALPVQKRQPNLLFGALRWFDAPVDEPAAALAVLQERSTEIAAVMRARATQTNEAARCAVMLPALGLLGGPLALLELGASAGLCLLPDVWTYAWTDEHGRTTRLGEPNLAAPALAGETASSEEAALGGATVLLEATVRGGPPLPERRPTIVARLGLDAHPVDATDPRERRWLRALVWPEHADRAQRLAAALDVAARHRLPIRSGVFPDDVPDAVGAVRALAGEAPIVVTHSAAAAYLDRAGRHRLAAVLDDLGVHRIGLEGAEVSRDLGVRGLDNVAAPGLAHRFVLSLDGRALGTAHPHGRDLDWWDAERAPA